MPAVLRKRAVRLAHAAIAGIEGLQGYVGVDLVLGAAPDGTRDYAIEINPRLTTSYIGLRQLCRSNLAQAWLDVLDGRDVVLDWEEGPVEFRADGTVLLNFNDISEKVRAALGVGLDGAPGLGLWDKDGKRIWQAPPSERAP